MLPDLAAVRAAAETLDGQAVRTPLLRNDQLDLLTGGRIFMKAESLQRTGSFKFRGAYNAISANLEAARKSGVIASSSGNHAQGIAEAARLFGVAATIIMPSDAPQTKKDRTLRSGATIIEYDRHGEDRDALLDAHSERSGAVKIHPFENPHVIAGQGTVGLEIAEDLAALGETPDHTIVCAGGGGLLAGVWLATHDAYPNCVFHSAEPDGHDDQARSHALGEIVGDNSKEPSVQDAIITPMPGESSFSILKGHVGDGLTATDDEALAAVAFAYRELKLVVEPGGACALATILAGKIDCTNKCVVVTLSGGNMDAAVLQRALAM